MADKYSGWRTTHSTSVVSESNTSKTIRVTCYWQNDGWNYDIGGVSAWVYCGGVEKKVKDNGSAYVPSNHGSYSQGSYDFVVSKGTSAKSVSCYAKITANSSYVTGTKSSSATSVSVAAKPSYTVSYNANGGSGAPSNQTKWYGTDLVLSSTKPTKTGYTFKTWYKNSTTSGISYQPGATYSTNSDLALYAVWTPNAYLVEYNANGGSGAPAPQTKTYGTDLTLSTTKPTRTDYNFLGWATSASGGVVYTPGATYINNSAVTLYAVWELAYVKPRLINFSAQRCDSAGATAEDGTYVKVTFNWATDNAKINVRVEWKAQNDSTWTAEYFNDSGVTSGSINEIIGEGAIDNETSYLFRACVTDREDDGTTYSPQITIGTVKYPIDVKNGGTGVAFGKTAEEDSIADFAYTVKLGGGLTPIFLEAETDLNDVLIPNFYTGENISSYNYVNCPLTSGTFYLEVVSMGADGQVRQRITSCSKDNSVSYERIYYQSTWGNWRDCYFGEEVIYDNESGSTGTITLSTAASQYVYLEIYFTDNNGSGCGHTKIHNPNGKTVDLSLIEASSGATTYFRRTKYTISGSTITPNTEYAGYVKITNATASTTGGTNYIKITRVIGKR